MTRLLFLPTPNILIWLEVSQSPDALLSAIERGEWLPPAPFQGIPVASLQAVCQGDLVTVTTWTDPTAPPPRLSQRQRQVLAHLVAGQTTRQIAFRLGLSTRMVMYHITELKQRFNAQTRAELVRKATIIEHS